MAEVRWFKTLKDYTDYVKAEGKGRTGEEFPVKELTEKEPKKKAAKKVKADE